MKTPHILAVAFAAVLAISCTRTPPPAAAVETRPFLKIGGLYRLTTTATGGDIAGAIPGQFVKVREYGDNGWFRAECFVVVVSGEKRMLSRRSNSSWINMAHVISATEERSMDELSPNAS